MRRFAVVIALAFGSACGWGSEPPIERLLDDAQAALRRGQLSVAADVLAKGQAATRSNPDSAEAWHVRLLEAEILLARLQLADALPILEAPVPDGAEFTAVRGRQWLLLARARLTQRNLDGADELIARARAIATDDHDLQLDAELLAGQVQFRKGNWAAGESGLTTAAARAVEAHDEYRQARAFNDLGMSYVVRNRYDEALSWFEKVLALENIEGQSIYGTSLYNAGLSLARLGQFDRAQALQVRAAEIHKDGRVQDYLQATGELGNTFLLQNDVDRALPFLQQAFDIAVKGNLPVDAALWARNLASAHVRSGGWDEAARYLAEARRLEPKSRPASELIAEVTEAQVAAGRGQHADAKRGFESVLTKSDAEPAARFIAYDGLSRLALAEKKSQDAERYLGAALDAVDRTRADLVRPDFKLSFLVRRISFYQAYVDLLVDQGRVDRALEVADSSRGRVLAERHGVDSPARATAASFRRLAAASRSVMLFYWLAPTESRVWVVTGDAIRVQTLPPAADIERLVAEHQATIQNAMADPLALAEGSGDRLFEALVAPVHRHIPPGATVVVVPDGVLNRINFETLTTGEGGRKHYWIEDVTVQIAPSLALLQRQDSRPTPASLLLVGNPTPRAPEFPALSYAAAEMTGISRHFPPGAVTTFAGDRASPEAFRGADPKRYAVIHFTSHAVANLESPLDSAVILSGPDQSYKLYARDVAAIPLTADLVTVSACRGAGERAYSGEGLVGFAWAFLRAGSHRVVAGLWDVDDRSTATLMDQVYAGIASGRPPAAALRDAKLALIKQGFPKPYYWAPFQLFTVTL